MTPDKPRGETTSAMGRKEVASTLHIGSDVCPECGEPIGESDPRRVYKVASGVMCLGHQGCADRYEMEEHNAPAPPPPPPLAPKNINFPSFSALQRFILQRGAAIPSDVNVAIGALVLQEGEP